MYLVQVIHTSKNDRPSILLKLNRNGIFQTLEIIFVQISTDLYIITRKKHLRRKVDSFLIKTSLTKQTSENVYIAVCKATANLLFHSTVQTFCCK